jgi:hypothetical protein
MNILINASLLEAAALKRMKIPSLTTIPITAKSIYVFGIEITFFLSELSKSLKNVLKRSI